jgi:hypothetical protein
MGMNEDSVGRSRPSQSRKEAIMVVGDRLRELWETQKKLSQGDASNRQKPSESGTDVRRHERNATGTFDRAGFLSIFAA